MGVDASRIMTVSYGKERPAAEEVQVNLGLKTEELLLLLVNNFFS